MSSKERIDKILSNLGYGSRKDIKKIIKKGFISIDGEIIRDNSLKIDPYNAIIRVEDKLVKYRENIYIMMNKPSGVVSSTDDPLNKTVIDLISNEYKIFNPFPVGRLDKDTEGLLILSNDGILAHSILSPKKHVNKKYYVEVLGKVTQEDIKIFSDGVFIDDYKTMPAKMDIIESNSISKVNLTIKEGKFHQVKRMFKSVNKEVTYLKRISMGNLKLDENLKLGQYREITEDEIELLKG